MSPDVIASPINRLMSSGEFACGMHTSPIAVLRSYMRSSPSRMAALPSLGVPTVFYQFPELRIQRFS
jgi:hypothetical protein